MTPSKFATSDPPCNCLSPKQGERTDPPPQHGPGASKSARARRCVRSPWTRVMAKIRVAMTCQQVLPVFTDQLCFSGSISRPWYFKITKEYFVRGSRIFCLHNTCLSMIWRNSNLHFYKMKWFLKCYCNWPTNNQVFKKIPPLGARW